jgi:hypothetical protein
MSNFLGLKKAGWFESPKEVAFKLNKDQLLQLKAGKCIEVKDGDLNYRFSIDRFADHRNLAKKDIIIYQI